MDVAARYLELKKEIATLGKAAGRDPSEITLVAVTKNHPLDHVRPTLDAGCQDFGENRIQEALEKQQEAPEGIAWHLIGTLQTKKVRKVVGKFALIHSVDSLQLAQRIAAVSQEMGVTTNCLLQVNTSGESTKHGFSPHDLRSCYRTIKTLAGIKVLGLMTMAPSTSDSEQIRRCFSDLRQLKEEIDPRLPHLSMGMSSDYPIAIEEGATLLRIGSRLFSE